MFHLNRLECMFLFAYHRRYNMDFSAIVIPEV